jgi:peptidyl-prolyl cis-trans isomerase A (cyclophilin A)
MFSRLLDLLAPRHASKLAANAGRTAGASMFEQLEERSLLTVAIDNPLPDTTAQRGGGAVTISLAGRYSDNTSISVVRFNTNFGDIDIQLNSNLAPNTVTNFLNYVNANRYNNTIFHRLTAVSNSGIGVLQGGGFTLPTANLTGVNTPTAGVPGQVTTNAPIALENPTGNAQWTISMARTNQPNSATSQFFLNVVDNNSLNAGGAEAGYAVFGVVTPASRAVLQQLYFQGGTNPLNNQWDIRGALQGSAVSGAFGETPLVSGFNGNFPIRPTDYLRINTATVLTNQTASSVYSVSATTSNSVIATAAIVNGQLVVTPQAGQLGTVSITVRARGFDGSIVDDTFDLTVTTAIPTAAGFQVRDVWTQGRSMPVFVPGVRDTDSAIARVDFFADANNDGVWDAGDTLLATDSSSAGGYNARLDTSSLTPGNVTLFARIVENETVPNATVLTRVVRILPAATANGPIVAAPTNIAPSGGFAIDADIGGVQTADIRRVSVWLDVNNNNQFNQFGERLIGSMSFNVATSTWVFEGFGSSLEIGANRLFVRVQDVTGVSTIIGSVTINVA